MRDDRDNSGPGRVATRARADPATNGRHRIAVDPLPTPRRPRIRVRPGDGHVIVELVDAEVLLEEDAVREVGDQLYALVAAGDTRLVLDFRRVRYISAAVLGKLVGLHRRVERARGRLRLRGLDPVLRDMLRICHLDRVLEIVPDEAEAPGPGPGVR